MLDALQVQRQLGISRATLMRWLRAGRITGYKAGKQWRFYPADVTAVLHDGPASYAAGLSTSERQTLAAAGVPLATDARLTPSVWECWQDTHAWLWFGVSIRGATAALCAGRRCDTDTQSWPLSLDGARQILQSWQPWRETPSAAVRPGAIRTVRGAGGEERTILCLATHYERVPTWRALAGRWVGRGISAALWREPGAWLIRGPAACGTAAIAFSLARECAQRMHWQATDIAIAEMEPTYFWPGALHTYGDDAAATAGLPARLLLTQSELLPSGTRWRLRGARVCVVYMFDPTITHAGIILRHDREIGRMALSG
jgi:excisionase family DNA binding protein